MIAPLDRSHEAAIRALIDGKAKPLGALGAIEDLAVRLALIAGRPNPSYDRALLLVFAGDHGLNESGVSAYPSAVTTAMVATLLAGRASANAFARTVGAEVRVVDAGVAADLAPHPALIDAKIRKASRNAQFGSALTADEVALALSHGAAIARRAAEEGFDILALGEMGIGNTASAALILHRLAPAPLADCIGPGAGHDVDGLARKRAVLEAAAARSLATEPLEVLSEFGGLEIVMMAGAVLGAAVQRLPVLIDGFIVSVAALAAIRLDPACADYCIFAHRSAERGHDIALAALGQRPLLDLAMRLGEGTGGLLALPLVRAAAALLSEVASLDDVLAGRLLMLRQVQLFLCAVQFLTRVPTPALKGFEPDWISRSTRYFPLVGLLVGLICAGVFWAASQVWSGWLPALLAIAAGVLVTGAFHEDGLADTADGLGGGSTVARRLAIMKDSRIGTYGALALGLVLAIKAAALASLPASLGACLIAAHAGGRGAAVLAMKLLPHVAEARSAKWKPAASGLSLTEVLIALTIAGLPLALSPDGVVLAGLAVGAILAAALGLAARRLLGGYTGDVLGGVEQVFELGLILGVAAAFAMAAS